MELRPVSYGPRQVLDGPGHYFTIGEAGVRWVLAEDTLPGRAAVGGWYSNGHFDRFDGTSESGTGGYYAMLEQKLWHKMFYNKTDAQGIYASSCNTGKPTKHISDVTDYFGGGLSWTGAIPTAGERHDRGGVRLRSVESCDLAPRGSPIVTKCRLRRSTVFR